MKGLPGNPQLTYKTRQLDRIIQDCLGLHIETTAAQNEAVPGETLHFRQVAINRSGYPVEWLGTTDHEAPFGDQQPVALPANQPVTREMDAVLSPDAPLTQPYWLREEGTPGMYRVDDPRSIGQPEAPPMFALTQSFRVGGETIRLADAPVQITADPAKGEIRRKLDVVPPVILALAREVELFTPGSQHGVEVEIRASRTDQNGTLALAAPGDWQVTPSSQDFHLAKIGDHARFIFTVKAPAAPATAVPHCSGYH